MIDDNKTEVTDGGVKKSKHRSEDITFTDEEIRKVAVLAFGGMGTTLIGREVNKTAHGIRKAMKDPRYTTVHSELVAMNMEAAMALFRSTMNELMGMAIERLKEELRPGSKGGVEAVKVVLKASGVLNEDGLDKGKDAQLTIVLPNTNQPVDITPRKNEDS